MSDHDGGHSGVGESVFGAAIDVGGELLAHAAGGMPLIGTAYHGVSALLHGYDMLTADSTAEKEKQGGEVATHALEAIPMFGTVMGLGELAFNLAPNGGPQHKKEGETFSDRVGDRLLK